MNNYIKYPDGKIYRRDATYFDYNLTCHDCGIENKLGNMHELGCDMELCPRCRRQLISCACFGENGNGFTVGTNIHLLDTIPKNYVNSKGQNLAENEPIDFKPPIVNTYKIEWNYDNDKDPEFVVFNPNTGKTKIIAVFPNAKTDREYGAPQCLLWEMIGKEQIQVRQGVKRESWSPALSSYMTCSN